MSPRLNSDEIRKSATGKWPSILAACGIDKGFLSSRPGGCPICQDGKDRYRFDDKDGRGTYFCQQCGPGDGFALLQKVKGLGFSEALRAVADQVGTAKPISIRHGRDEAEVRAEMNDIWRSGKPLADIEATAKWWTRRLGRVPESQELRAVRSLRCNGYPDMAGMVARIRDAAGSPISLHRTYLTAGGDRADIPSPRRVMDIKLPEGCAVRLAPAGEELGVAEGIETAESCREIFGIPTWATLNAGNMKGFVPPPGVRRLVIFGDLDGSFTGQAAAFELARRCWAMRKQREPELQIEVRIWGLSIDPNAWDRDWNDVLMRSLGGRVQQAREQAA